MQQSTVLNNAQKWIRGAWLDTINMPLNDMQWYTGHCLRILRMTDEGERLSAIDALLHRTDPGEGGLYVDLGSLDGFRCVAEDLSWEQDPAACAPRICSTTCTGDDPLSRQRGWHNEYPITTRWVHRARTLYGTPLRVHLEALRTARPTPCRLPTPI
jgi:hypothetical protein